MAHLGSRNGLLVNILAILCLIQSVHPVSAEVLTSVSVEALLLSDKTNRHMLKFKVSNNGNVPLTLEGFSLPWIKETPLLLLLAVRPDGTELRPYLPEAGAPSEGPVTLKVGESVEGNVSLNHKFPELARESEKQDIIFFWSAQILTREGVKLPRVGGWLLVPRAPAKKPD